MQHKKGGLYVSEPAVTTDFIISDGFFLKKREWSETGTRVFVVQVERYTTNSLSLAGVNHLYKHFTLRIDILKQPRKETITIGVTCGASQ